MARALCAGRERGRSGQGVSAGCSPVQRLMFPSRPSTALAGALQSAPDRLVLCFSPTSCFGATGLRSEQSFLVPPESTDIFRGQAYNPFPYDFSFELLVKGPCLLAGMRVMFLRRLLFLSFGGLLMLMEVKGQ